MDGQSGVWSAPEAHLPGRGRFQPPNVTNASLLKTYGFHASHRLHELQRRINELSIFYRLFPAQAFLSLLCLAIFCSPRSYQKTVDLCRVSRINGV